MDSLKHLFLPIDMTSGTPWKKITLFTIPLLFGNIAQQLYNTVDSIIIGYYLGDNALAAVGSTAPIITLLLTFFIGISSGTGVMISQYFGAKKSEDLSSTIGSCITLNALSSLLIMIAGPLLTEPLLRLLNTPESLIAGCKTYLTIIFITIMGMSYFNILSGILRALGDSFSALLYLIISTVLNIVLDILFVAGLHAGIAGVAWATVIAQWLSCLLSFRKLYKMKHIFILQFRHLRPNKKYMLRIIQLGLPSGLAQVVMSMSNIIVQSLSNSFGELFITANVIATRINSFASLPNLSFETAMTTYTGQNVGARRIDRVNSGLKQGTLTSLIVSAAMIGMLSVFGPFLTSFFSSTPEVIALSTHMIHTIMFGYIALAVIHSLAGVMRGAGDTVTPFWIALISTVITRVPLAYGISIMTATPKLPNGSYECIYVSMLISWWLGAVITLYLNHRGRWKKIIQKDLLAK